MNQNDIFSLYGSELSKQISLFDSSRGIAGGKEAAK